MLDCTHHLCPPLRHWSWDHKKFGSSHGVPSPCPASTEQRQSSPGPVPHSSQTKSISLAEPNSKDSPRHNLVRYPDQQLTPSTNITARSD